ncbi:MAG: hypothetical protein LQ351_004479 [Letrouitia transgressa]|nr:MAG: hypothetical protein LQ351_004479 [Letrouitia transgressa]
MRISFSWGVGSFPEEERGFLREFDQKKLWSKYLVNISTLFWSRDYFLAGRIGLRIRRVIARLSMTRLTIAFRDICLFCTVRSQFAAVRRASLQVQKRRFQSESRAPKQSTEAVSRDHYELTNLEEQSETVQTDIRQNVSDSRELLDEFLNTSKPFREPISRSVQWRNVYGQEDNGDDERCASCHIDGPSKKDASNFPQRQLLATYHTFSTPKLDHSVIGLKFSTRRFYSNARPVNPKLDLPLDSSRNGDPSRKAFLENEPAMRHVQLAATKPRRAIEAPISPKNSDLSSEERLARWPAQRSREPDVRQDIRDNPRLVSSQPSLREQDRPSFSGLPRERGKRESSGYISWTEALKPASRDQGQMWTSQQPRERAGQQRHRDAFWPDTSKSLQNGRNQEQVSQHPRRHAVQHGSAQKRLNNQRSDLGPKVEAFDRDGNGEYFSETLSFGMEDSDLEAERSNPIIQRKRLRNWREDVGNISRFSRHRPPESESYRFGRSRKSRFAKDHESDMEDYDEERQEARERRKAQRKKEKEAQARSSPPTPIYLPEFISVSNLAKILKVRVEAFAKKLKELGFEETNTDHVLEAEVAGLIAAEFNFEPIVEKMEDLDLQPRPPAENKSLVPQRPPIVTIMGHVDHGKTTLLDYLRKSSVAASEHGGITQHIGAFSVCMPEGRLVTFLDTPGHEAFLSMRQRGANVTDIVILVVAADDSVKPQTVEAIKHAQAAKVPMIAAINKIDKEDSNIERVKQDLARYGVEIEDFGGDTQVVCVSGKTGQGLDELEDAIVALADIIDMRAETDGQAEGWVLEATTKKAGRVATVLVRRGTIKAGDVIVAGSTWSRIRSLKNEAGLEVSEAGPGTPVEVDGWRGQPFAGDQVLQANSEHQAKSVVEFRVKRAEKAQLTLDMNAMNEARRTDQEKQEAQETNASQNNADALKDTSEQQQRDQGEQKNQGAPLVNLLIKADVSGSIEAVTKILSTLSSPQVSASVLRATVGPVNESDVVLAAAAPAHIISFNQDIEGHIRRMAESQGVQILEERIIYRLADKVKEVLENMLPAIVTKRVLGEAEISQVFEINARGRKVVLIAGCRVRNGSVGRGMKISVMRGEGREVVYDGSLSSLKNHKKDVQEMGKGTECGMGFEKWSEFQVGDLVQAYEEKSERRRL